MSDQEWRPQTLFDSPVVRQDTQVQITIEQPGGETLQRPAPPVPDEAADALRAALADPRLAAELWNGIEEDVVPESNDAEAVVQLGTALYLLQALHSQDRPGHEHLPRRGREPSRPEEDEGPGN